MKEEHRYLLDLPDVKQWAEDNEVSDEQLEHALETLLEDGAEGRYTLEEMGISNPKQLRELNAQLQPIKTKAILENDKAILEQVVDLLKGVKNPDLPVVFAAQDHEGGNYRAVSGAPGDQVLLMAREIGIVVQPGIMAYFQFQAKQAQQGVVGATEIPPMPEELKKKLGMS